MKIIKDPKRKNQMEITFFRSSFSVDQVDGFSELL